MKKSKRYRVAISYKCVSYYEVIANNKEQAMLEARERYDAGATEPDDYWESHSTVDDCEEIPFEKKPEGT